MSAVFEHSKAKGVDRMILLALADHCDDFGVAYPGVSRIAKKCLVSERTVQRAVQRIRKLGELEIMTGKGIEVHGHGHTNRYRVITNPGCQSVTPAAGRGDTGVTPRGDTAVSPKPSGESSVKEEEEPASSFKKSKASPKLPNSRESDEPEKEKLLPVLERWREVYEIVLGSPYVESRKDMEALSHLLHRWPDADQLAGVIESAFLLVGHPKAWTCNNRMETIDAFAVNIAKIMGEVKKHAVLPEAQHRMELARRERLWINNHKMAMEWLRKKFGAQAILESFVPMAVVNYLMGDDDLGEVPPYFRCLFSHENPNVTLNHGYAAEEELDDANMEGFVEFLKFHGWWMDLSAYERGR